MNGPLEVDSPKALRALPASALEEVCRQLREEIIATCGKVGGHLGASLGAVELIVALHRVFHSPKDKLVFDVGHQAYAHKLLTGRRLRMGTLRQEGGVAPFLDPTESEHDALAAGHACTAVSAALGMQEALRLTGAEGRAVAIIGDGALTGGLTFEGLNNAGVSGLPLVVVLNDNQMSISTNVGAISTMLRGPMARQFFEALGFTYLGPVDGHDLSALIPLLESARRSHRPVLVHVHTLKGKGFAAAEADERTRGHAMGPYEWRDGKLVRSRGGHTTFSEAFADVLEAKMAADPRVVTVTPAMLEGSALVGLKERFPDRVFDVGIAEQHAVTFSAGLAARGLLPVCAIYSTFLQRAYDQVVHDVCLPKLPVVFAIDRAGLVGADGATHQGAYDLSFLRPLPGMGIAAPVWGEDLGPLLDAALASGGPFALRFPRGTLPAADATRPPVVSTRPAAVATGQPLCRSGLPAATESAHPAEPQTDGARSPGEQFACGSGLPTATALRARWLKKVPAPTLTIIALGPLGLSALEAAATEPWNVLDALSLSPLDTEAITEASRSGRLITVEEGTSRGGLGSAVLEHLSAHHHPCQVTTLGLPDRFIRHGDARAQRKVLGLDADGIRRAAQALLDSPE